MYLRVPVHLLGSQMSAVETLPDCFSHICPPLQVDEVKSITHLLLALSQSVALPFSPQSQFILFSFKALLFFSHSQNLYFEASLPSMIFFLFSKSPPPTLPLPRTHPLCLCSSCGTNIFFFFFFSNLVHSLPTQVARPYEVRLPGGPTRGLVPFQPPQFLLVSQI